MKTDDIKEAILLERMKKEAERLDEQVREMLRSNNKEKK